MVDLLPIISKALLGVAIFLASRTSVNAQPTVTTQPADQPALHRLSGVTRSSNHTVSLGITGEVTALLEPYYDLYPLEVSSNLSDWIPLATLLRTNATVAPLNFVDADAALSQHRFYRTPTNQFPTFLPAPTGPFAVGVTARLLTDTNRTDRRPFMISIWYPAQPKAAAWPNAYMDPLISEQYGSNWVGGGSVPILGPLYASFYAHSTPDAPVVAGPVAFPVVVYSHAWTGVRTENSAQAENLASHGYFAIGIDHEAAFASVYPNREVAQGANDDSVPPRIQDIQFTLDQLALWNKDDPLLAGRFDLNHVGAMGWSLGGGTAFELCADEPRCTAVVSLDGGLPSPQSTFTQPVLAMAGGGWDPVAFLDFFSSRSQDVYLFKIANAMHAEFSDLPLVVNTRQTSNQYGFPSDYAPPGEASLRVAALLRIYTLSFFNKYLKGQDDHVLDGPLADYPEIENYMGK
jgi:hypothetical protein